nr:M20/M25/M40 family metallo-hydrolase [Pirellula staleyi]
MRLAPSFRTLVLGGLLAAAGPWTAAAQTTAEIDARLEKSVSYLASDELEGRGLGTAGLDKAADYIAAEFAQLGLRTELFEGSPFQKFELTIATELGPADKNKISFTTTKEGAATITLALDNDFTPLAVGGSKSFSGGIVFAGYGITAKELKAGDKTLSYDDYAGLNCEGKIVIVLRKEPQQKDKNSPFDGDKNSQHALFNRKIANASEHGAAAIIFVNDGEEIIARDAELKKVIEISQAELEKLKQAFAEKKEPTEEEKKAHSEAVAKAETEIAALQKEAAIGSDRPLPFTGAGPETTHPNLPILFATRSSIDRLLEASLGKKLADLEAAIDADLKPQSAELAGYTATGETTLISKKAQVKNVVAILEGEGPLADETIIVGAHYDHLGMGGEGSLAPWTKEIHNGADDNASGTATLLEVAREMVESGKKPSRRIVFIAFTGEEKGLLGSAHYVRQPRFPLENTVAMFNLDMVGRLTNEKLIVYGTGTAKQFEPMVESLAKKYEFALTKQPGGFGPSDHSSFYARKIPVLHLFTDVHSDYHRPSDDSPKLNISGMRRVAQMLVEIVTTTDADAKRPEYVELKQIETIAGDENRPYFGSIPDFSQTAEGYALSGVVEGGPAAKAGIIAGDIIVKLGDSKITNLQDFDSALRKYKIGDKVKVTVLRGKETLEKEVTISARRRTP